MVTYNPFTLSHINLVLTYLVRTKHIHMSEYHNMTYDSKGCTSRGVAEALADKRPNGQGQGRRHPARWMRGRQRCRRSRGGCTGGQEAAA